MISIIPYPHLVLAAVQYGYPAACTLEKAKTATNVDFVQWTVYWIICCVLMVLETHFLWFVVPKIPLYCELKLIFVLWLVLPEYRGAAWLWYAKLRKIYAEFDDKNYDKIFGVIAKMNVKLPEDAKVGSVVASDKQEEINKHLQEASETKTG